MTAFERFLNRKGTAATVYQFVPAGSDSWGDPTSDTPTETTTVAIVNLLGYNIRTVTVAGVKVEIDAEVIIPASVSIDFSGEERPEIEVSGVRYVLWLPDPGRVAGGQRILATRKAA